MSAVWTFLEIGFSFCWDLFVPFHVQDCKPIAFYQISEAVGFATGAVGRVIRAAGSSIGAVGGTIGDVGGAGRNVAGEILRTM